MPIFTNKISGSTEKVSPSAGTPTNTTPPPTFLQKYYFGNTIQAMFTLSGQRLEKRGIGEDNKLTGESQIWKIAPLKGYQSSKRNNKNVLIKIYWTGEEYFFNYHILSRVDRKDEFQQQSWRKIEAAKLELETTMEKKIYDFKADQIKNIDYLKLKH